MKNSPFAFFRKYQRVGMVALTVMAMFSFVFMDTFTGRGGGGNVQADQIAVKVAGGNLTAMQLSELRKKRGDINEFIARMLVTVYTADEKDKPNDQQLSQRVRMHQFGIEWPGEPESDHNIVWGHLMRLEAKRLGLVVTDAMVTSQITRMTENKLTPDQFRDILSSSNMREKQLYDLFRDELLARNAWMITRPMIDHTPEQYWEYYRRMKVRQNLEVAALPVSEFAKLIKDPADSVLQPFFEAHKQRFAEQGPDYATPGFRQPYKVRVQYLTANYDDVEKTIPAISDKDVTDFYEKNKDSLYRAIEKPDAPTAGENDPLNPELAPESPAAPALPENDTPKSDAPAKDTPAKDTPAKDTPAKDATEKPAADKPAAEKKPEEVKPEEVKPEEVKPEEKKPEEKKPEEKKPEEKSETEAKPEKSCEDQPAADKAAAEEKKPATEKPADAKPEEPKPAAEKPADAKPADPKPAAEKPAADKPATETSKDEKPAAEKPAGEKPAADAPALEKPVTAPVKYQPLTDDLKENIRDELLRQRTQEALKKASTDALQILDDRKLRYNMPVSVIDNKAYVDFDEDSELDGDEPFVESKTKLDPEATEKIPAEITNELREKVISIAANDLKNVGKKLGMKFSATELVSAKEIDETPGLGKVIDEGDNPFQPGGAGRILNVLFGKEQLYSAEMGKDSETQDVYVYWKAEQVKSHVPKFTDPGIKEQVLAAWKLQEAYPVATKRAAELAKLTGNKEKLEVALKGQTVTNDKAGLPVLVHETADFSWMTPATPSPNMWETQPPTLSTIAFVENADEEFMQVACDELGIGEAGFAPNRDHSIVYVIRVINREPKPGEETDRLRETFMKERLFGIIPGVIPSAYSHIASQDDVKLAYEWMEGLKQKYHVSFTDEEKNF